MEGVLSTPPVQVLLTLLTSLSFSYFRPIDCLTRTTAHRPYNSLPNMMVRKSLMTNVSVSVSRRGSISAAASAGVLCCMSKKVVIVMS